MTTISHLLIVLFTSLLLSVGHRFLNYDNITTFQVKFAVDVRVFYECTAGIDADKSEPQLLERNRGSRC